MRRGGNSRKEKRRDGMDEVEPMWKVNDGKLNGMGNWCHEDSGCIHGQACW